MGRERNLQQSKEREAVPALWFSYLRKGVFTEGKRFGNCFVLERGDVCYIDSVVFYGCPCPGSYFPARIRLKCSDDIPRYEAICLRGMRCSMSGFSC